MLLWIWVLILGFAVAVGVFAFTELILPNLALEIWKKKYGLVAKSFVEQFFDGAEEVIVCTREKGKYGRYLGDFKVADKWLCAELLAHHHAVEYLGQSKALIKAAHMKNRYLVEL